MILKKHQERGLSTESSASLAWEGRGRHASMPTSDTRTREAYRRLVRHELMQPTDDRQLNDPVPAVSRSAVPPDFGKGSALLRTPSLAVAPVALPQRHRLAQLLESRSLPALPQHRSRPNRRARRWRRTP